MADTSMPLSTPGMTTITSMSLMENALSDKKFNDIRRPLNSVCVDTAAITGMRSFLLRNANTIATALAKGFIEK